MPTECRLDSTDICENIRRIATEQALSRKALAEKAGVSSRVVYLVMTGQARLRDSTIGRFAQALGVSPGKLTGRGVAGGGRMIAEARSVYPHGADDNDQENGSAIDTVEKALAVLSAQLRIPLAKLRRFVFELSVKEHDK